MQFRNLVLIRVVVIVVAIAGVAAVLVASRLTPQAANPAFSDSRRFRQRRRERQRSGGDGAAEQCHESLRRGTLPQRASVGVSALLHAR